MGRTLTPDGKRNPWSVKLSDAKSAAADSMRGTTPRALWLESLIDAALAGRPLDIGGVRITVTADERIPEGVIVARGSDGPVAARTEPPASAPEPARKRQRKTAPPDRVEAAKAAAEAAGAPLVPASELAPPAQVKRCGHPGTRMVGGFCKTCDHLIAPGGLWR